MNEFTYHLQIIGHPQSGRSTFLAASYYRARELLRSLGKASLSLSCTDQASREFIDRILSHVRVNGDYPKLSGCPDTLRLHFYNLHAPTRLFGEREIAVCYWIWHKLSLPDSSAALPDADGSCLFIDAAQLMDDIAYRAKLDELTGVALSIAQKAHRRPHPFAIVLTKCDLLGQMTPALRRVLNRELIPLTEALARSESLHQVFFSSLAIGVVPNTQRYFLLSSDSAAAPLWLMDTIHPLNQAPLNVDLDQLLNAR
ncbi:hypothetical protein [Gloeobacter kilaueensis]|uniref:Uncharacterized protein n=1 Tax=Gloeobacter kilaueensis (strain ATCC BAA-2537 / CCAP 1431/1 / ULC 316 / JS1) TaxID=1183438 RepID=U5QPK8_GLOK1|nr:hypothetical protein [Gloeobacter kilaueensis]AGY59554.1 hypothetical protein GKIL_3308 [Gloeobacter kilaueensis JS1]